MSTRVQHGVDGGAATENPATGKPDSTIVESRLGNGVLIPTIALRIAQPGPEAQERDIEPAPIGSAGLDEHHGMPRLGKSRRDDAARGAAADNDVLRLADQLVSHRHRSDNTRVRVRNQPAFVPRPIETTTIPPRMAP